MNYLSFKEIVEIYGLKNEATSKVKIKEILKKINIPCGIYLRDDKFTTDSGIVNLHPTKGTHWVMFVNEFYFDSLTTVHLQLIYLKTLKKVSIQNINIRPATVIVQRVVYMFYFLHKL